MLPRRNHTRACRGRRGCRPASRCCRPARGASDQRPAIRAGDGLPPERPGWIGRNESRKSSPDRALDVLKIPKGGVVADVGAGSGYFTVRLADRVGPTGKVYAADIQPEMLRLLGLRLTRDRISNVTLVQGDVDNPRLPAAALDLVLMVDVYRTSSRRRRPCCGICVMRSSPTAGSCCWSTGKRIRRFRSARTTR